MSRKIKVKSNKYCMKSTTFEELTGIEVSNVEDWDNGKVCLPPDKFGGLVFGRGEGQVGVDEATNLAQKAMLGITGVSITSMVIAWLLGLGIYENWLDAFKFLGYTLLLVIGCLYFLIPVYGQIVFFFPDHRLMIYNWSIEVSTISPQGITEVYFWLTAVPMVFIGFAILFVIFVITRD